MKKIIFLVLLVPSLALAQYDFESRYFTMDAESLYDMEDFNLDDFDFEKKSFFTLSALKDYSKVTAKNYWQAVDMMAALDRQNPNKYASSIRYPQQAAKKEKSVSLNFYTRGEDNTTSHGIRNSVYKEMRSAYYCSPLDTYSVNRN